MKIKILEPCLVSGKEALQGCELDLSDKDARTLVNIRKAVYINKTDKTMGGLTTYSSSEIIKGKKGRK